MATRLCRCAPIAVAIALAVPSHASAGVRDYDLHVDGTSCLFRAFALERSLAQLDGVRLVEIEPATGAISMTMDDDATMMPDDLVRTVEEAGLEVRSISATARGSVRGSAEGGRLGLGGSRALVLLEGPGTDKLRSLLGEGRRSLEIQGRLRRHGDGWGVVVERVTEPTPPEDEEQ